MHRHMHVLMACGRWNHRSHIGVVHAGVRGMVNGLHSWVVFQFHGPKTLHVFVDVGIGVVDVLGNRSLRMRIVVVVKLLLHGHHDMVLRHILQS